MCVALKCCPLAPCEPWLFIRDDLDESLGCITFLTVGTDVVRDERDTPTHVNNTSRGQIHKTDVTPAFFFFISSRPHESKNASDEDMLRCDV